jgi:ribosome maturation factor RimP
MDEMVKQAIDESMAEISVVSGEDIYLVDLVVRAGGRVMELTVDTDKGISIDQCARLSRSIRGRLEACTENDMLATGDFDLLVSSPGIGEPIRIPRQYLRHMGRLFKIVSIDAGGERREIDGRLLEASVSEGQNPSITIQPFTAGKKKHHTTGQPPVTVFLRDVVKAVVQAEW